MTQVILQEPQASCYQDTSSWQRRMLEFSSLKISVNLELDFRFSSGSLLNWELDHQFRFRMVQFRFVNSKPNFFCSKISLIAIENYICCLLLPPNCDQSLNHQKKSQCAWWHHLRPQYIYPPVADNIQNMFCERTLKMSCQLISRIRSSPLHLLLRTNCIMHPGMSILAL